MIRLQEIIGTPSLQYHIDNELSLHENVYRYSSDSFIQLFSEARDLWRDGMIELNEEDTELLETTDIGEYGQYEGKKVPLDLPMAEGSYEEGGEDDRKHALLRVEPRNYEDMIDKLQDMNINHNRISDTVIKVYTDRIPDKIIYNLTHDVWVDKFVLREAEYQGKDVALNKPKRGGSKKFYVYVKNKKGNIVKVSFGGTTGLNVKIDEPGARSSFAARHKCATKKDKTKPGYWACNIGRYWKSLGGSKNFSGYW
tara:strand:- start:5507 stop:6268 length:762 start_codon:yes stop_codon:yes gene_type:complete